MCLDCMITYGLIFTVVAIGTDIMGNLYNFSEEQTGFIIMIPNLICGLIAIPSGILADKYGKR